MKITELLDLKGIELGVSVGSKEEAINEGTEKVPFFVRFYTLIVGNMV